MGEGGGGGGGDRQKALHIPLLQFFLCNFYKDTS